MTGNPYHGHLAERVLGADPVELIALLYEELASSIASARRALAASDPRQRARAVSRAMEIVSELDRALDPSPDPELARHLSRLYAFLLDQLHSAHANQLDAPLANAERVVHILLEAWQALRSPRLQSAPPLQPLEPSTVSVAG